MVISRSSDASQPDTFVPFERAHVEQSVPQRFAWQVERHASRLAVRFGDESLTYGTLDQLSSRIATGILEALGPGAGPVALLFDSGMTHAVSQLGVLKAGKICVPMDATYPVPRLRAMLADMGTRAVLTDRAHHGQAAELCGSLPGVEPFEVEAWVASAPDRGHALDIAPGTIAYVLYTSGSTGEPKGVMQTHRNLLHLARVYGNAVELRPSDRLFCPMPLAYSGAIWALATAWTNGAALCRGAVDAPTDILSQLALADATVAQLMVSMLRNVLVSASGAKRFPKLRLVFTGGEVLYGTDVERFRAVLPGCRLLYDLGSTEAGIISLYWPRPAPRGGHAGSVSAPAQAVPAGYPVDDVDVLLLDGGLAPVPDGATGQLAVRSEFISPGYWGSVDRTATRFVKDPAGSGRPVYLTGDLGRRLEDGCLLHLGRADFETKIQGHRVAPGEIERALREMPALTDAAVASWTDAQGDAYLVAYMTCPDSARPTVTRLRQHLQRSLPVYMVPSRFVFVPTLPLLPNGKIDRAALSPPEGVRPTLDVPFVPPRTPVETLVAGVWADVLGVDRVGALDGFIDLGGNSLLAARVAAKLWDSRSIALPVPDVLEAPSLADLARRVLELAAAGAPVSASLSHDAPVLDGET